MQNIKIDSISLNVKSWEYIFDKSSSSSPKISRLFELDFEYLRRLRTCVETI